MGKLSAIFLNGKIKNSIHYLNDERKGLSTFYFRNGNEKFSINHTNDGKSIFNIEKSLRKFGENITVAIKNSNIKQIKDLRKCLIKKKNPYFTYDNISIK